MKRKNVLDGKYFLVRQALTAFVPTDPREKIIHGQILGEAAEGWFLADLFDSNRNPVTEDFKTVSQSLMRIEEFKDAEFFVEIGELGNMVHKTGCKLSRLPAINKSQKNNLTKDA